ncbi:carboxylate--amine ligase [Sphingosinicella sp.]|uniref:carboxylate--amine ligase n=1 Tax=Sphingosinicella sp. TaxID=1917971 RepID=UPI0040382CD4
MERALVLGDDMGVFLAVARSLGRRGIEVHVAPADSDAPGLASRYVSAVHVLPPYHADPRAWLASLQALIAAHRYRLILPCNDSRLLTLRHHAAELGREILAIPDEGVLATFTDKAATRALATRLAIATPRGRLLGPGEQTSRLIAELGVPLVLKPCRTYEIGDRQEKVMARILRTPAELGDALETARVGPWLAEAFVPGEGVGVSVLAREGEVLLAWQHRRLRVAAETAGSTARVAERPDRRLLAAARAMARASDLTGIAMFEFRVDRRGGRSALLEVNPRFWGSLPLAVAAGADFPALLWDVLTGTEPRLEARQSRIIARRSMSGEYARLGDALAQASGSGARLRAAVALLAFPPTLFLRRRFDSWAADDPDPYRRELRQLCGLALGRVARRLHLART